MASVAARFDGQYTTLWSAPRGFRDQLTGGDSGPDVDWIAARLAQLERHAGAGRWARPSTARTRARCASSRATQNLKADGVAGPRTYMRLNQLGGVAEPRLLAAAQRAGTLDVIHSRSPEKSPGRTPAGQCADPRRACRCGAAASARRRTRGDAADRHRRSALAALLAVAARGAWWLARAGASAGRADCGGRCKSPRPPPVVAAPAIAPARRRWRWRRRRDRRLRRSRRPLPAKAPAAVAG